MSNQYQNQQNSEQAERYRAIGTMLHNAYRYYGKMGEQATQNQTESLSIDLSVFSEALAEYPLSVIDIAFKHHYKKSQWLPKASDISSLCVELMAAEVGHSASKAWQSLSKALRCEPKGSPCPRFYDPNLPAVIEQIGGWTYLTSVTETVLNSFIRKDFMLAYQDIANQKNLGSSLCKLESKRSEQQALPSQ